MMKQLLRRLLLVFGMWTAWVFVSMAAGEPKTAPQAAVVYVLGEVREPQMVPYTPALTLAVAIATTGGMADFGATPICLIRKGSVIFKTDARRLFATHPTDDPLLKARDVVYVGSITDLHKWVKNHSLPNLPSLPSS